MIPPSSASSADTSNRRLVCDIHTRGFTPHTDTATATAAYENIEIITRSHPDAFPSALSQKRKTQTKIHQGKVLPKVHTATRRNRTSNHHSLLPGLGKMSRMWTYGSLLRRKTGTPSHPASTPCLISCRCRCVVPTRDRPSCIPYVIAIVHCPSSLFDRGHTTQCVSCKYGWRVNN